MSGTFSTIAYAIAVGSIGFAFAIAMTGPRYRRDRSRFFCLALIALLAHVLGQLIVISGLYQIAPHLVGFDLAIKTVLGPAVFFYTRAMVSAHPLRLGGFDWLALLGPVLVLLVNIPFATLSADEKLALVDPATRNPDHYQIAVFACTASLTIFLVTTAVYLIAAVRLQMRHRRRIKDELANIERQSLDWLRRVLFVFAVAALFFATKQLLWLSGTALPSIDIALAFTGSFAIATFAFLGIRQPDLSSNQPLPVPGTAARQPILSEERLRRTAAKLKTALNTDRFYADSDLSLRKLSDATGITKNHISETLSQHLGVNFFDFVNSHRATEAKTLLAETDLSILEISLEVGFNSRSTFNAAFKKHVGVAPSAYRSEAKAAQPVRTA